MEAYQHLEKELQAWTAMPHVAVTSSGTSALHLALESLRLPPGSKVMVPDFAMYAVAAAVRMAGHTPVFIDCLGADLNISVDLMYRYRYPFAVIAVHTYGRRCEMDRIIGFGKAAARYVNNKVQIIEDMSEIHGMLPHPETDLAVWSFYKNKVVAGEEGGCVAGTATTGDCIDRVRQLRSLGFTEDHDFTHVPRGVNARLSNANAELIRKSLARWDEPLPGGNDLPAGMPPLRQRRWIESWYDEECPPSWRMPPRAVPWVYDLRIPGLTGEQQNQLVKTLRSAGFEARHGFKPLSLQKEFVKGRAIKREVHEALVASREIIYLPIQPYITTRQTVKEAFRLLLHAYNHLPVREQPEEPTDSPTEAPTL